MKLSIIIVNYNVVYFLEQCLYSVHKAIKDIDAEIFVVDNNSVDGSTKMVKEKFPEVSLIENKTNYGFSYANNQAIKISKGEYVILLNPDTVVEENTFLKVVSFMDKNQDAGGLGVKMIDGKGKFLPESKRGLPTPSVAFYKIFGVSRIFPKSKKFGKYHLGYLDKNKTNIVDVLAGAFMMLRKNVLNKIGLLDETFFMYGEDIDLSYRITKGGYKNYYFPETTIIHYKGESTKKGSINYVKVFYNAMIIFAKKHFSQKNANLFSFLINIAIYLRAAIALISTFLKNAFLPILDASMIFFGFYSVKPYWEAYKFPDGGTYPDEFLLYAVPGYIIVWLFSIFLTGGYEKPAKILNILKGLLLGTLLILVFYALLSEEYRFSRALILIGSAWGFITIIFTRLLFNIFNISPYKLYSNKKKRVAVIGATEEADRVCKIMNKSENKPNIIGYINPTIDGKNKNFIGNINQLQEIIRVNKIDELIFCAKDITAQRIIKNMLVLSDVNIEYKIASPDSISVIGSNSINTSGDLYTINLNSIARLSNKRNKRLLDIILSLLILSVIPIIFALQKKPFKFLYNIIKVLFGFYSWVGYKTENISVNLSLPKIKPGILNPSDVTIKDGLSKELITRLNIAYARDYKILNDLSIIVKGIRMLGK